MEPNTPMPAQPTPMPPTQPVQPISVIPPAPSVPPQPVQPVQPPTPTPVPPPPVPPVMVAPPAPPTPPKQSGAAPTPQNHSWGTFLMILLVMIILGVVAFLAVGYMKQASTPDMSVVAPVATSTATTTSMAVWKGYTNTQYGFAFQYPGNYDLTQTDEGGIQIGTQSPYQILVTVKSDTTQQGVKTCQNGFSQTTTIGGISFLYATSSDGASGGQRGEDAEYRAVRNNVCYHISTMIGWHEVAQAMEYPSPIEREAALKAETEKNQQQIIDERAQVDSIIKTFSFGSTASSTASTTPAN